MTTSKELHCIARLKIKPGQLAEFKRLNALCNESVRTKDSGTLRYDLFFNADETECVVLESYRDADALIEHFNNLGPLYNQVLETCAGEGEICGVPNEKLKQMLEGAPVRVFMPYKAG